MRGWSNAGVTVPKSCWLAESLLMRIPHAPGTRPGDSTTRHTATPHSRCRAWATVLGVTCLSGSRHSATSATCFPCPVPSPLPSLGTRPALSEPVPHNLACGNRSNAPSLASKGQEIACRAAPSAPHLLPYASVSVSQTTRVRLLSGDGQLQAAGTQRLSPCMHCTRARHTKTPCQHTGTRFWTHPSRPALKTRLLPRSARSYVMLACTRVQSNIISQNAALQARI